MAGTVRLSPNDLTTLATDHGQVPMNIAAVLVLDGGAAGTAEVIGQRLAAVPRLRQSLRRGGRRRLYWADAAFDIREHVAAMAPCADEQALLAAAGGLVCQRLPMTRPLWAMRWCEMADGRLAVVLVVHHVLADGMGGLALLAALVDGLGPPPAAPDSQKGPGVRQAARGLRELGVSGRPRLVAPTSITRPTSSRRRVAVARLELAPVVAVAHDHAVTVNDVVIAAVSEVLFDLLDSRGERPPELVVSVPISMRGTGEQLGNQVGAVPVAVPRGLDFGLRVAHIAGRTRAAKAGARGSSSVILGWAFRGLGAVRLAQFFVDRQRLVHTFETNLRGPAQPLVIDGRTVEAIVPIAVNPGNVGVSFDVLSYAGRLLISVVADPEQVDAQAVAGSLQEVLAGL
ncbi:MAG: WS/DGAT domain-containing protein [Candidatus Nanopelagicales bacterium]|nr:WS/DGAT domain-containing protein [Candidatus Nanopelagicales bacterium]